MTLGVENLPPEVCLAAGDMLEACAVVPQTMPSVGVTGKPIKCGALSALQTTKDGRAVRVRILLSVYTSNYGRYAVLSQDKAVRRDCGFINLKNATVRTVDMPNGGSNSQHCVQILPRDADVQGVTFCAASAAEASQWLAVLQGCPTSSQNKAAGRRRLASLSVTQNLPALEEEWNGRTNVVCWLNLLNLANPRLFINTWVVLSRSTNCCETSRVTQRETSRDHVDERASLQGVVCFRPPWQCSLPTGFVTSGTVFDF